MSDAKIMTLNDLNGSEQFTQDYAPYRAVERSENLGEGGKWYCGDHNLPSPLVQITVVANRDLISSSMYLH